MGHDDLRTPQHDAIRGFLRVAGPLILLTGAAFLVVGIGNFFAAFGSFEPPRYFWCAFVGIPMLGLGMILTKLGYLGAIARYLAAEAAPVAKDTVNYLGAGTQPGVEAISRAAARGAARGLRDAEGPDGSAS